MCIATPLAPGAPLQNQSDTTGTTEHIQPAKMSESSPEAPNNNKPRRSKKIPRKVSDLTPAQIARKRANDRDAQREIRQRTKEYIEKLERRLDEVEGKDETLQSLVKHIELLEHKQESLDSNNKRMQGLIEHNEALKREIMALRKCLGIQGRPLYPASPEYSSPSSFHSLSHSLSDRTTVGNFPTPEPYSFQWSAVPVAVAPVVARTAAVSSLLSPSSGSLNEHVPGGEDIPTSVLFDMMSCTCTSVDTEPTLGFSNGTEEGMWIDGKNMYSDNVYSYPPYHPSQHNNVC
ncbi:hypothetical protein B0T17DRAFT_620795 [Bombardia bombarda]|uniref:BZIP domain-containing protein n=1 Tax=Bombardia bombarda TaxID=252184 RepID=A0AA39W4V5_9PEZI|nr:hypothetical protein B0T17DRAFT_620795 [Bombardia bombarda]